MIPSVAALLAEIDAEVATTRRVLERVPAERLEWRPHPKSMTLGQLAQHVASIPAVPARIGVQDGFDVSTRSAEYPAAQSPAALVATLDASIAALREFLSGLDEERAGASFRLHFGDRDIARWSRLGLVRTMALNHWYHHRGELAVYLRLLDVPVPVIYGRSADENPFAAGAAGS